MPRSSGKPLRALDDEVREEVEVRRAAEAARCRSLRYHDTKAFKPPVPRLAPRLPLPLLEVKPVLHLFSGQRRRGNFQFHLESVMNRHTRSLGSTSNVVVLGIDIVLRQLGYLTNPTEPSLWIDLLLKCIVIFRPRRLAL